MAATNLYYIIAVRDENLQPGMEEYIIDLQTNQKIPQPIVRKSTFKNELEIAALANSKKEELQMCKGMVRPGYISDAIKQNNFFMMLKRKDLTKSTEFAVTGFVIGQFNPGYGYIDVICGEGGKQLIDNFVQIAEDKRCQYVELSSLPNVLAYYPKLGFEHRKQCIGPADVTIPYDFAEQLKKDMRGKTGSDIEKYYHTPSSGNLKNFIIHLHQKGFTSSKEAECQNPQMVWDEYYLNNCHIDGFKMRMCLPRRKAGGSRIRGTRRNRRKAKKTCKNRRNH